VTVWKQQQQSIQSTGKSVHSLSAQSQRQKLLSTMDDMSGSLMSFKKVVPAPVVRHIARSINVNTTADEIKTTAGLLDFVGNKTEVALLEFTKNVCHTSYKRDVCIFLGYIIFLRLDFIFFCIAP
jgi:hypothetical protein